MSPRSLRWTREVLDLDPSASRRRLRRGRGAKLPRAGGGTRVRGRLDTGADRVAHTVSRAAGAVVLGSGAPHPLAAGRRGAHQGAARTAAAGPAPLPRAH